MELKKYEGVWKDGKPNGQGTKYYENGKKYYEGEWKNNLCHGFGTIYYENGNKKYEGDHVDGRASDTGELELAAGANHCRNGKEP